jgi:soluble P-type ATPase
MGDFTMLTIDIPGFGAAHLEHLVSDFTGTLSMDGRLLPGVRERLAAIAGFLQIHILTADTFDMAGEELTDISCDLFILTGDNHDIQKEEYVRKLDTEKVVAFGNGNNDRRMLKAARVGMAVSQGEGCAASALLAADIHVASADIGLDLLLHPRRLKATLRF